VSRRGGFVTGCGVRMKVLVAGGAGFIGSHLVEQLLREPDVSLVRVADNFSTGRPENLEPFLSRVEVVRGDLVEEDVRRRAVRGVDVVFHQAAVPSVPRSVEDPLGAHHNGVHLTVGLLDESRRAGVRRFILAASSSAYGDAATLPKREDMAPSPLSPYAATKVACEQYVTAFARCYAMDTVSLRYFNVFGPRQDPGSPYSGVIARFCTAFCNGGELSVHGDGEQSRDFTYVANVVQANLLAARHPEPLRGEVFNVGAGQRCSLNELIGLLEQITGRRAAVQRLAPRTGDVRHSLADIRKAGDVLGYRPTVAVWDGLARTLAWYHGLHDRQPD
jgi:UDP-glucose 4-epimerase